MVEIREIVSTLPLTVTCHSCFLGYLAENADTRTHVCAATLPLSLSLLMSRVGRGVIAAEATAAATTRTILGPAAVRSRHACFRMFAERYGKGRTLKL